MFYLKQGFTLSSFFAPYISNTSLIICFSFTCLKGESVQVMHIIYSFNAPSIAPVGVNFNSIPHQYYQTQTYCSRYLHLISVQPPCALNGFHRMRVGFSHGCGYGWCTRLAYDGAVSVVDLYTIQLQVCLLFSFILIVIVVLLGKTCHFSAQRFCRKLLL